MAKASLLYYTSSSPSPHRLVDVRDVSFPRKDVVGKYPTEPADAESLRTTDGVPSVYERSRRESRKPVLSLWLVGEAYNAAQRR